MPAATRRFTPPAQSSGSDTQPPRAGAHCHDAGEITPQQAAAYVTAVLPELIRLADLTGLHDLAFILDMGRREANEIRTGRRTARRSRAGERR